MGGTRELTPTPPHPERRQNERLAELERQVRVLSAQRPTDAPIVQESWHTVGATSEPAFAAGFAATGSPYSTPSYFLDATGILHLKGSVTRTGAITSADPDVAFMYNGTAFTLPVGYRPAERNTFIAVTLDRQNNIFLTGYIQVKPGGQVQVLVPGNTTTSWQFFLDGMSCPVK